MHRSKNGIIIHVHHACIINYYTDWRHLPGTFFGPGSRNNENSLQLGINKLTWRHLTPVEALSTFMSSPNNSIICRAALGLGQIIAQLYK